MTSSDRLRQQLSSWFVAAIVGALGTALAGLLTAPASAPFPGHGEDFARQAADPFSLVGAFPQRILWPLLAHLGGRLGIGPAMFSQVCSGFLLAVVFWSCRRRSASVVDALLVTAAVGATGAVQLYQLMTCHSDSLNWALMLLLVHHVGRRTVFWPLVLLCALSHEMIFFFAPWLVYLRWRQSGLLGVECASLAAVVALYQLWRMLVRSIGHVQGYDVQYYLTNHWLPWGTPGLWLLWAMMLVVEFGPILAVVVWAWRTDRLSMGPAGPWLLLAGVLSLMVFAYDVQRFASYAFLPLVLGSVPLLALPGGRAVYAGLWGAGICSYLGLHWAKGQAGGWVFDRVSGLMLEQGVPFDHARFFTAVLPLVWPAALGFAAAAAAIFAFGFWLARRFPEPARSDAAGG